MRLELDEHAWNQGFEDGRQGKPLHANPYNPGTTESWSWASAYIEGKAAARENGLKKCACKNVGSPGGCVMTRFWRNTTLFGHNCRHITVLAWNVHAPYEPRCSIHYTCALTVRNRT